MNEIVLSGYTLDRNKIDLLKRTICKGASDDELEQFLHHCARLKLDPFTNQIYSLPLRGKRTVFIGIDGMRALANRTGNYAPGKKVEYTYDANGKVLSATAYVMKRNEDGTWHEVGVEAFMEEYKPSYKSDTWERLGRVMIAKCAESLALRKAFPADLSGLYEPSEMKQAAKEESDITIEVKPEDEKKEEEIKAKEIESEKQKMIAILQLATDLQMKLNLSNGEWLGDYLMQFKDSLLKIENPLEKFSSDRFIEGYQKWLIEKQKQE